METQIGWPSMVYGLAQYLVDWYMDL